MSLSDPLRERIRRLTGARDATPGERIQSLWSGYGEILRVRLEGAPMPSVVVKHVRPPTATNHPRGWNTSISHERKLRSYEVERTWYRSWSDRCTAACRVPRCIDCSAERGEWLFLLEDLDAAGFDGRRSDPSDAEIDRCLSWLAAFHATFLGERPEGLWPTGTYWHLATRPDELAAIEEPGLRRAAPLIDARLEACRFRSFVHGDAKIANFCFAPDGAVAAVDFQYVGGGCGMKDVAYFLSSCLYAEECEARATPYLDRYFERLRGALAHRDDVDRDALEAEWRTLYPLAWADFYRFLAGWSPGHWKIHPYSRRLTDEVLRDLAQA